MSKLCRHPDLPYLQSCLEETQGEAPKPTVDDLEIVHVPRTRAYVREFTGFATEGKALDEAVRLRADLLADKV